MKLIKRYLIPKYLLGRVIDWIKHPIYHMASTWEGWFPTEHTDTEGNPLKNTIYVDKNNQRLHYYDNAGLLLLNFPVSTGAIEGPKLKNGDMRTPTGTFSITSSTNKADKNIFGDTLFYNVTGKDDNSKSWSGIGIHGHANNPDKLGRPASHGCIRLANGDLRCLLSHIGEGIGTTVIIKKQGGNI